MKNQRMKAKRILFSIVRGHDGSLTFLYLSQVGRLTMLGRRDFYFSSIKQHTVPFKFKQVILVNMILELRQKFS